MNLKTSIKAAHSCLLVVMLLAQPAACSDLSKALQFGTSFGDYVKFTPDMNQVKYAHTLCSWVKKMQIGNYRSWLTYTTAHHPYELLVSDAGGYNYIHDHSLGIQSSVSVPLNSWTHQCQTWSTSTGTLKVYYNGVKVGSKIISNRSPLEEKGYVLLGHDSGSKSSSEIFGGQLLNLNFFRRVLTDAEISEMYKAGKCADIDKKYESVRVITWDRIKKEPRTGSVKEVDSGCPACACPPDSVMDVLRQDKYLKKTFTSEMLKELKTFWSVLDNFVGSTITKEIIAHLKMLLPEVGSECHVPIAKEEKKKKKDKRCLCSPRSMWDNLLAEKYMILDQPFTAEKLKKLKASWDVLDHFVGSTITEGIVTFLKSGCKA